jgi:hypothetical protein
MFKMQARAGGKATTRVGQRPFDERLVLVELQAARALQ